MLVYEGEGKFNEFVGGYDEYKMQKKQKRDTIAPLGALKPKQTRNKLSFKEQRELAQLPQKIEVLEQNIEALQLQMADPKFYQQEAHRIAEINQDLASDEALLSELYARWEVLEDVEK